MEDNSMDRHFDLEGWNGREGRGCEAEILNCSATYQALMQTATTSSENETAHKHCLQTPERSFEEEKSDNDWIDPSQAKRKFHGQVKDDEISMHSYLFPLNSDTIADSYEKNFEFYCGLDTTLEDSHEDRGADESGKAPVKKRSDFCLDIETDAVKQLSAANKVEGSNTEETPDPEEIPVKIPHLCILGQRQGRRALLDDKENIRVDMKATQQDSHTYMISEQDPFPCDLLYRNSDEPTKERQLFRSKGVNYLVPWKPATTMTSPSSSPLEETTHQNNVQHYRGDEEYDEDWINPSQAGRKDHNHRMVNKMTLQKSLKPSKLTYHVDERKGTLTDTCFNDEELETLVDLYENDILKWLKHDESKFFGLGGPSRRNFTAQDEIASVGEVSSPKAKYGERVETGENKEEKNDQQQKLDSKEMETVSVCNVRKGSDSAEDCVEGSVEKNEDTHEDQDQLIDDNGWKQDDGNETSDGEIFIAEVTHDNVTVTVIESSQEKGFFSKKTVNID